MSKFPNSFFIINIIVQSGRKVTKQHIKKIISIVLRFLSASEVTFITMFSTFIQVSGAIILPLCKKWSQVKNILGQNCHVLWNLSQTEKCYSFELNICIYNTAEFQRWLYFARLNMHMAKVLKYLFFFNLEIQKEGWLYKNGRNIKHHHLIQSSSARIFLGLLTRAWQYSLKNACHRSQVSGCDQNQTKFTRIEGQLGSLTWQWGKLNNTAKM